jgi:hypothetical protein
MLSILSITIGAGEVFLMVGIMREFLSWEVMLIPQKISPMEKHLQLERTTTIFKTKL